ncbi:hypothetical protein Moror_1442 [Moniliophthora roreri MCA 2997]|uniref:Uncharacterized protein n=1 Tax=Moniliophthora roreri (strain MCA 2997) TaxID=1381753 RepID=V2YPX5_MONRO|nr:hypothetical protein Moror_1442 [Moniliophthora roreri MCA 2997]KAI3596702.1 hypothetical protein WG66_016416 [Moniliophthora roreri]
MHLFYALPLLLVAFAQALTINEIQKRDSECVICTPDGCVPCLAPSVQEVKKRGSDCVICGADGVCHDC